MSGYSSESSDEGGGDSVLPRAATSREAWVDGEEEDDSGEDWNEQFQTLVERTARLGDSSAEEHYELAVQLREVCESFAARAATIGVQIIKERMLPASLKRFKPVTAEVGGFAGGEKYIRENIFFKFSVDQFGLYGGDENASKAAEHEVKSYMALVDCRIVGLHTPLTAVIHHCGVSLIAMSLLPIGCNTLVYGTADAGKHIKADDAKFDSMMKTVARLLNLKTHTVTEREGSKRSVAVHGPADMEGHRARDGRNYVVDCARLFPPVEPNKELKGAVLYRLFRPEFVKRNCCPLSSDAFTKLGKGDEALEHNQEVREATHRLENDVIAAFACTLEATVDGNNEDAGDAMASVQLTSGASPPVSLRTGRDCVTEMHNAQVLRDLTTTPMMAELPQLVSDLHTHGINCRYLPLLLRSLHSPHAHVLVTSEIVSRYCKNLIRRGWRRIASSHCDAMLSDKEFRKEVANVFCLVFGNSRFSDEFWSDTMPRAVLLNSTFQIESTAERAARYERTHENAMFEDMMRFPGIQVVFGNLRSYTNEFAVLQRVCTLLSLDVTYPPALFSSSSFTVMAERSMRPAAPFTVEHIQEIKPVIKHLNRISFEEATSLSRRAAQMSDVKQAIALFAEADLKYQETVAICPNDSRALYNWGHSLCRYAMTLARAQEQQVTDAGSAVSPEQLFDAAASKYQAALVVNPRDAQARYMWGNMLVAKASLLPASSRTGTSLLRKAHKKYQEALALPTGCRDFGILYNSALTSMTLYGRQAGKTGGDRAAAALLDHAIQRFMECTEIRPSSSNAWHNLAVARAKKARLEEGRARDSAFDVCFRTYGIALRRARETSATPAALAKLYFDWGNALYRCAKGKLLQIENGDADAKHDAFELFQSAGLKYHEAAKATEPSFFDVAFTNLSLVIHAMITLVKWRSVGSSPGFISVAEAHMDQISRHMGVLAMRSDQKDAAIKTLIELRGLENTDISKHAVTLIGALMQHTSSTNEILRQRSTSSAEHTSSTPEIQSPQTARVVRRESSRPASTAVNMSASADDAQSALSDSSSSAIIQREAATTPCVAARITRPRSCSTPNPVADAQALLEPPSPRCDEKQKATPPAKKRLPRISRWVRKMSPFRHKTSQAGTQRQDDATAAPSPKASFRRRLRLPTSFSSPELANDAMRSSSTSVECVPTDSVQSLPALRCAIPWSGDELVWLECVASTFPTHMIERSVAICRCVSSELFYRKSLVVLNGVEVLQNAEARESGEMTMMLMTSIHRKYLVEDAEIIVPRSPYVCELAAASCIGDELRCFYAVTDCTLLLRLAPVAAFTRAEKQAIVAQLVLAIEYLEAQQVAPSAIDPSSVFISPQGKIQVLADASLGKSDIRKSEEQQLGVSANTLVHTAPELGRSARASDSAVWWSFGVIMYEFLTNKALSSGRNMSEVFGIMTAPRQHVRFPDGVVEEERALVLGLLDPNPDNRLRGQSIRTLAFFDGMDWGEFDTVSMPASFERLRGEIEERSLKKLGSTAIEVMQRNPQPGATDSLQFEQGTESSAGGIAFAPTMMAPAVENKWSGFTLVEPVTIFERQ